jgi:hypothetical protein
MFCAAISFVMFLSFAEKENALLTSKAQGICLGFLRSPQFSIVKPNPPATILFV